MSKWARVSVTAKPRWLATAVLGVLLLGPFFVKTWAENRPASSADSAGIGSVIAAAPSQEPNVQTAQWLVRQPDHGFTLQLVTVSSEHPLEDFARRAGSQTSETLAAFRYQKNEQLLYVLVLGFFATPEAAFEAQATLQIEGLAAEDTWVRSLADVKQTIRTTLQK